LIGSSSKCYEMSVKPPEGLGRWEKAHVAGRRQR